MKRNRLRGKKIGFLLAGLILVLLLVAGGAGLSRSRLTGGERVARDGAAFLQGGAAAIGGKLAQIPKFFADMEELNRQNQQLRQEVAELNARLAKTESYQQENQRLRQVLGLSQEMADWQPVAAEVIGRDTDNWYDVITIRGGAAQGFARDQAVIAASGLVGRILSVSTNSAQVQLITDGDAAVACMIQESRVAGVLEPADRLSNLQMIHIPGSQQVQQGETVITSGLGGIYPYGLRIGSVSQVKEEQGGLTQVAQIAPFVDFSKLETVLVLLAQPADNGQYQPVGEESAEELPEETGLQP